MIFRRTANGISNQHLFLNVDAIVFVEGGDSYSKSEAYNGKFDTHSIDIKFWKGIFSIYCEQKKFQFRAIGSKTTLQSIAKDISMGRVANTYVAMDRDFDSVHGNLVHARQVLYTYGYSWENDVWHPDIVCDVFESFNIDGTSSALLNGEIQLLCHDFIDKISVAVFADACLSLNGLTFIPRNKHMCCLEISKNSIPCVNIHKIDELLCKFRLSKKELQDFARTADINPFRDCYGHLLSDFCYFLISYLLKNAAKLPLIAKHYVVSLGIDKFLDRLKSQQLLVLWRYYDGLFFPGPMAPNEPAAINRAKL